MVWWNPLSWFSRSAQTVLANANTSVLRNALRNYIKAVNNLQNKNNAHIYGLMMKTANGANASYKNRMVNGIAKIVAASHRGIAQAATAVANGAPEGAAAVAVNNATAAIKNLNNRMAELNTLLPPGATATPNNKARLYMAKKYNNSANRTINKNGKYAPIWAAINSLKTQNRLKAALPARTNVPNLVSVLAFLNEHKNDNVNKAARIMAGKFKNSNLSTLNLPNLSNKQHEILNKAVQFKRNNNALRAERAGKKLNQDVTNVVNNANLSQQIGPNSKKGQVAGVERNVYYHKNNRNGYFIKNTNGYYKKLSNGNANTGTWPAPTNNRKYEYNRNDGFEAIGTSTN